MSYALVLKHLAEGAAIYSAVDTYRKNRNGNGLGAAPSNQQLVLDVQRQFDFWVAQINRAKSGMDEGLARTLDNLVASATRLYNRFIGGELAAGESLARTMRATIDLIRTANASNLPTVEEFYDTTVTAIQNLVVATGRTAGAAAGAAVKAAADAAGVDPKDVGAGIGKLATAAIVVGGAVILIQLAPLIKRFSK